MCAAQSWLHFWLTAGKRILKTKGLRWHRLRGLKTEGAWESISIKRNSNVKFEIDDDKNLKLMKHLIKNLLIKTPFNIFKSFFHCPDDHAEKVQFLLENIS